MSKRSLNRTAGLLTYQAVMKHAEHTEELSKQLKPLELVDLDYGSALTDAELLVEGPPVTKAEVMKYLVRPLPATSSVKLRKWLQGRTYSNRLLLEEFARWGITHRLLSIIMLNLLTHPVPEVQMKALEFAMKRFEDGPEGGERPGRGGDELVEVQRTYEQELMGEGGTPVKQSVTVKGKTRARVEAVEMVKGLRSEGGGGE